MKSACYAHILSQQHEKLSDLEKDEKKVESYRSKIEEINIDKMLEKDENEVLYGRAGYLSGGFTISDSRI